MSEGAPMTTLDKVALCIMALITIAGFALAIWFGGMFMKAESLYHQERMNGTLDDD